MISDGTRIAIVLLPVKPTLNNAAKIINRPITYKLRAFIIMYKIKN